MGRFIAMVLLGGWISVSGCTPRHQGDPMLTMLLGGDERAIGIEGLERHYDPVTLLRRGESAYDQGEYLEAAAEFQRFLDLHPANRLASYAQFKLAMAYYHQIDTVDRDREPLEKALQAFEVHEARYPRGLFAEKVRAKLAEVRRLLAERELYVGRFYFKRGAYEAALARFDRAIDPDSGPAVLSEALYLAGRSQQILGQNEEAARLFQKLLDEHPDSPRSSQALPLLNRLRTDGVGR